MIESGQVEEILVDSSNDIKVLYVITTFGGGGAESQLFTFVSNAKSHGITPIVCVLRESGSMITRFNEMGINYFILHTRSVLKHIWATVKIASDQRVSIIHAHMLYSGLIARVAGLFCDVKVVVTEHGLGIWKRKPVVLVDRMTAFLVDRFVYVSQASCNIRLKREKRAKKLVAVIPNGVIGQGSDDIVEIVEKQTYVIGTVARLAYVKRLDILLHAFSQLCENMDNVRLEIIGEGHCRSELYRICQEFKIVDKVKFLGWQDNVISCIKKWDIFALTSEREDCPVSLLEAMSVGLPCVASSVGGIPEMLSDGCGILIEDLDAHGFSHAFETLIMDLQLRRSLSDAAVKRVKSQYTIDKIIEKNRKLYMELIERQ